MEITSPLYHGTTASNVYAIAVEGFRIGDIRHGRERGRGLYLSTLSGAAMWGDYLVKCELAAGTRILWHEEVDRSVIKYLSREFGRGVLSPDFWKVLPANKQLKRTEITALFHHFIHEAYFKTLRKRNKRDDLLRSCFSRIYSELRAHGFDGVCINWPDSPELMLFNPSQAKVLSIHTWSFQPTTDRMRFWDFPYDEGVILSKPIGLQTLEEIQKRGRVDEGLSDDELGKEPE